MTMLLTIWLLAPKVMIQREIVIIDIAVIPCMKPFAAATFQVELERLKFFAKPRVALDAVGGDSGVRIAEALAEVGRVGGHMGPHKLFGKYGFGGRCLILRCG